jgi:hypothetical protein
MSVYLFTSFIFLFFYHFFLPFYYALYPVPGEKSQSCLEYVYSLFYDSLTVGEFSYRVGLFWGVCCASPCFGPVWPHLLDMNLHQSTINSQIPSTNVPIPGRGSLNYNCEHPVANPILQIAHGFLANHGSLMQSVPLFSRVFDGVAMDSSVAYRMSKI